MRNFWLVVNGNVVELSILIGVDCGGADCVVLGGGVDGDSGTVVVGGVEAMVDLVRLSVAAATGSRAYQLEKAGYQLVASWLPHVTGFGPSRSNTIGYKIDWYLCV
jgi:hypothetical protein